jgi:hypothetical protein
MREGDIGYPRALRTLSDCFFVRFDYWKQLERNAGLKAVGGRLFPNPAFRNRSTECRAVAYGRYGTALRPGFADQRFRHIRHISRNAPFPQAEAFVFVECHPSFRSVSLKPMVRSMFPLESKTRISPLQKLRAGFRISGGLIFLRKHWLDARSFKDFPAPTVRFDFNDCHGGGQRFAAALGLGCG